MELLIFSDSHGNAMGMRSALARQIRRPHAVCFLGDGIPEAELLETGNGPVWHVVRGNCDRGTVGDGYPTERLLEQEGHRLLMTHGHIYHVKDTLSLLLASAVEKGADLILYGHTHEPLNCTIPAGETVAGVTVPRTTYLFNPGSIGIRSGSFGTLHLRENEVLFSHGSIY